MKLHSSTVAIVACLFLVGIQLCYASFVTFIVPSGGRRSIIATLDSLQAQTDTGWNAVVVFDGLEPQMDGKRRLPFNFLLPSRFSSDKRIYFHNLPAPVGHVNCGAQVRNAGMFLVRTQWVAFVDDDDTLSPLYVRLLRKEAKLTRADLVVFRMHNELLGDKPVLPLPNATTLQINMVGISFAYRQDAFDHEKRFRPNTAEDFEMLHRLCREKLRCVISPYLTYFVHGKSGNLPLVQGKRVLVPSTSLALTQNVDWELRMGKAQCSRETQGTTALPFIFTEEDDLFFGRNVMALKAALERASQKGCIGANVGSDSIHVIFRHDTPPARQKYIQIQMEQHSSKMMDAKYMGKLEAASQIWEMTPSSAKRLTKVLPTKEDVIYSVPTTTYVNPDDVPITCSDKINSEKVNGEFYSYESKCYSRWSVERGVFFSQLEQYLPSDCGTRKCPLPPEPVMNKKTMGIQPSLSDPDVLVYGALNCSAGNRREELCDLLQHPRNGFTTACLHSVFGAVLEHFICNSKVIVIESFYEGASLSSHRIDALLLAGKIIVSTPSSLPSSNKAYEDFIFLVKKEDIPSTVKKILENYSEFNALALNNRQRFIDIVRNVDPLCYSLRGIA